MIAVIAVVAGFGNGSALTHAFGFSVATVFFVTDTFLFLSIPFVKDLAWIFAISYFVFYAFIDGEYSTSVVSPSLFRPFFSSRTSLSSLFVVAGLFWGASLKKVPEGAWFPLGLGVIL